jgi:hypothetical protein
MRTLVTLLFAAGLARAAGAPPSPEVKFYGAVIANLFYNAGPVNNLDVPFMASATGSGDTFGATARQTRLGLNVKLSGAGPWGAEVAGRVEGDFFGGLADNAFAASKPIPRLRLAWMALEWARFRVQIGQDWMVLSPVNPFSVAHQVVAALATSGNLWERAPQLRGEWKDAWGDASAGVQLAAVGLTDNELFDGSVQRERPFTLLRGADPAALGLWPATQLRAWAGYKLPSGKPGVVGVSGHFHQERYTLDTGAGYVANAFAAALDVAAPFFSWLQVSGEVFWGQDLDAFMGGAFQGVTKTLVDMGTPAKKALTAVWPVHAWGGWAQLVVTPLPWLSLSAAGGFDDPLDTELVAGMRASNIAVYGAATATLAPGLRASLEYDWIQTAYLGGATRSSGHLNLGAMFEF